MVLLVLGYLFENDHTRMYYMYEWLVAQIAETFYRQFDERSLFVAVDLHDTIMSIICFNFM